MPMEEAAKPLRLFVALAVPEDVRQALRQAQEDIRSGLPLQAVGWTRPEQFHLTLKFLGSVRQTDVDALAASLKSACARFGPMRIECAGVGFFPTASRPRVIWVGLHTLGGLLQELHEATEASCAPFTAEKPENRFHVHVTLGRVKQAGRREIETMQAWAENHEQHSFGTWTACGAVLVQSQLSPKGAGYSNLAEFPFERNG